MLRQIYYRRIFSGLLENATVKRWEIEVSLKKNPEIELMQYSNIWTSNNTAGPFLCKLTQTVCIIRSCARCVI